MLQFLPCSYHDGCFLLHKPLDKNCRQVGGEEAFASFALLFDLEFPSSIAQQNYGLWGLYGVI